MSGVWPGRAGRRGVRAPDAFNALVAAAIACSSTDARRLPRRKALADAAAEASMAAMATDGGWPADAEALLHAARAFLNGRADRVPPAIIGRALDARWPALPPVPSRPAPPHWSA